MKIFRDIYISTPSLFLVFLSLFSIYLAVIGQYEAAMAGAGAAVAASALKQEKNEKDEEIEYLIEKNINLKIENDYLKKKAEEREKLYRVFFEERKQMQDEFYNQRQQWLNKQEQLLNERFELISNQYKELPSTSQEPFEIENRAVSEPIELQQHEDE